MSKEHNDHYNNILDVFDVGPVVKTSITLYRGMTKRYKMFDNESFISTTTDKNIAKTFGKGSSCCLYIITLTPGQYTILPLEHISEMPEEYEVLLPPGSLSIQMVVPYTDTENKESIDLVYCTYIPKNAEIIENNFNITEKFEKARKTLSTQSWVDRVLNSGIVEQIQLLCENENFTECVLDEIKLLDFYDDMPQESIDKVLQLLNNITLT